jgi:hypothetical protein
MILVGCGGIWWDMVGSGGIWIWWDLVVGSFDSTRSRKLVGSVVESFDSTNFPKFPRVALWRWFSVESMKFYCRATLRFENPETWRWMQWKPGSYTTAS